MVCIFVPEKLLWIQTLAFVRFLEEIQLDSRLDVINSVDIKNIHT